MDTITENSATPPELSVVQIIDRVRSEISFAAEHLARVRELVLLDVDEGVMKHSDLLELVRTVAKKYETTAQFSVSVSGRRAELKCWDHA